MRKFKENFILKYGENYMLINMISFRRKMISADDYLLLKSINSKNFIHLNNVEEAIIKKLFEEKQLLSEELIAWYDTQRELNYNKPSYHIGSITLNLTYDCNFSCKYCYQKNFNLNGKYMSFDDINKIYDYVQTYNKIHNNSDNLEEVIISGGESLLDHNIDKIVYICNKFESSKFKLFTNGTNIIKFSDKIDFTKFSEIQVSLDGVDEVIRTLNKNKSSSFDNIVSGILFLVEKGIKVSIISMVTKESLPYLNKFLDFLEDKKIIDNELISLRFSFVVNYDEKYTLDPNFYSPEEYLAIRQKVNNAIHVKGSKNISVDILYDLSFFYKIAFRNQNERIDGRIAMCNTRKGFPLLFSPDHGIYWCTCTNVKSKLASFDNPPEELDKSQLLNELLHRNIYKIEQCKKCFYRFVCSSGCPLYAIHCNESANTCHCGIFGHPLFEERAELFLGT